jgi:hypothetical protein
MAQESADLLLNLRIAQQTQRLTRLGIVRARNLGFEEVMSTRSPVTSSVVKFAVDSLLEGSGFEPSVPRRALSARCRAIAFRPRTAPSVRRERAAAARAPDDRATANKGSINVKWAAAALLSIIGGRGIDPGIISQLKPGISTEQDAVS